MSLITAQDAHIKRILNATPYSYENRKSNMYGHTLLNRKLATLRASRSQYENDLRKLGFNEEQIWITMKDAEDMAILEHGADN